MRKLFWVLVVSSLLSGCQWYVEAVDRVVPVPASLKTVEQRHVAP